MKESVRNRPATPYSMQENKRMTDRVTYNQLMEAWASCRERNEESKRTLLAFREIAGLDMAPADFVALAYAGLVCEEENEFPYFLDVEEFIETLVEVTDCDTEIPMIWPCGWDPVEECGREDFWTFEHEGKSLATHASEEVQFWYACWQEAYKYRG